jgi:arsenite methyltransferase
MLEIVIDGPLHPGGREATGDLLDRAAVDSETQLLDVGCGAGDALRLAREREARAVGLDHQPTVTGAVQGDLTSLPFREESFNVVLGECVLCLSSDLERTLAEIERLLKPGGRLALSDVTVAGTTPTSASRRTALSRWASPTDTHTPTDRARGLCNQRRTDTP